uniref:Uncharacterized protein n=1 Tax=Ditylenchus dipsaci TaxID=166011 RepID=A0A915E3P1_9BILA
MPRVFNAEFFARMLSRKSGRKISAHYADWNNFEGKMKQIANSNELKGSLLWLGSTIKDSEEVLNRLEISFESLRESVNHRLDGIFGRSKDGSYRDNISAGFEDLMHKRTRFLFPSSEIRRNVILTKPYISKDGVIKQLREGEIDILVCEPYIIIEVSLSLRASDLERVLSKKLQLSQMFSIAPELIPHNIGFSG